MPDTVTFNEIPSNIRVPFWYAEINSGGSPFESQPRLLLVGQKLSAGSAAAGVPIGPVQSESEVVGLAGLGSMLQYQYRIARQNAPFQPIWLLPLADPSGAAAAGSVTIGTAPAQSGFGAVRVMGRDITFQINAADTSAIIAGNLIAAINAMSLPVGALIDGSNTAKCNLTARHVGASGNSINVILSKLDGNLLTSGNATIVAMSTGSGVPSLATPLANLGSDEYDFITGPYADTTSLNAVRDFLGGTAGRWTPSQMLYGHYFTAFFGILSAQVSLGSSRNDPHASIMGSQVSPTPEWEWSAALAAQACVHLANPPELSRPLQTLPLTGVLPPDDRSTWWAISDRQALYTDGIAGYKISVDGTVMIDRCCTTYQKTAAGASDATFLDVETMFQFTYATRYMRQQVENNHSRQSLGDDNPFNISSMATPKSIRNTLIHGYNDLVALGVADEPDIFAQYVVVERSSLDSDRVNAYLPMQAIGQLRVFAANVTAFLQYLSASGVPYPNV